MQESQLQVLQDRLSPVEMTNTMRLVSVTLKTLHGCQKTPEDRLEEVIQSEEQKKTD